MISTTLESPCRCSTANSFSKRASQSGQRSLVLAILTAIAASSPALLAQSVTVTPSGYVAVAPNSTTQFDATVSGLSSTAVTWSVAGNAATYGTITSSGLYTAPATAPANPAEIVAASVASPTTKGYQFVYFLTPGPTVSQVSPNPIPVGTTTVTVTGLGFQKGAEIEYSAAGGTQIQASTRFVNSTTLTAGIYFGAPTAATFYVVIPGPRPVTRWRFPWELRRLSTYRREWDRKRSYAAGTVVTITANAALSGEAFSSWSGATVASASSSSTTLTMPAANTTVTANYTTATYPLTVVNGTGSGSYAAGTVVTITANAAPSGEAFSSWSGATVASASSSTTTLTMPAASTTVTANYTTATHPLTVVNGTGSGSYAAGTVVTITANAAPSGEAFSSWSGATVASASSSTTTLTMPAASTHRDGELHGDLSTYRREWDRKRQLRGRQGSDYRGQRRASRRSFQLLVRRDCGVRIVLHDDPHDASGKHHRDGELHGDLSTYRREWDRKRQLRGRQGSDYRGQRRASRRSFQLLVRRDCGQRQRIWHDAHDARGGHDCDSFLFGAG